jgi:hypothetical protein
VLGAPLAEHNVESPVEALPATTGESRLEDNKPKASKRGSIFGKLPGGWGSMKSPSKEKDFKDAELKPEVPPKDVGVAETAPQIPETTAAEPIESALPTTTTGEATTPAISEPIAADTSRNNEVLTPGKEKKSFLSGLGFMNKRDRSVSPSAFKETPTKAETPAVTPVAEETAPIEPLKTEEPAFQTPVATDSPMDSIDKSVEPVHDPQATDAVSPNAKRQSVFGNLSRRASKALNRMQTPTKKENTVPTTATTAEEESVPATTTTDKLAEPSSTAPITSTEENKPESVGMASHTPVAASA